MTSTGVTCTQAGEPLRYVMGEIGGDELVEFTRHLQTCDLCAEEVRLLQQAADAMPLLDAEDAGSERPEPARRSRRGSLRALEGGAANAPQNVRPSQDANPGPNAEANAAAAREAAAIREATAAGAARRATTARRPLKQPVPRPAMFGFAALVLIGVLTLVLTHRADGISYVRVKAGWTPGGAALQLQGNKLELLVEGMPRPQASSGYQIWTLDSLTDRLAPTNSWLHLNKLGEAGVAVAGDYHNWDAIAVYVEPLHGQDSTRSGAVVVADLRNRH